MDPVALLEGALKVYGPATQEQAIGDYLVAQMQALGLRAFRDEAGNAVGMSESSTSAAERGRDRVGAPEIVLLGHMDTVPGYIDVRREGDRLYGRGAVDARGPPCTVIAAAAQVGV